MTKIVPEQDELCEVCGEPVDYCPCVRCMTCELLYLDSVVMKYDKEGWPICPTCHKEGLSK